MKQLVIAFVCACTSIYGSEMLVTNPAMLSTTDTVNWSQLSYVGQSFWAYSNDNESMIGTLANGPGSLVKVCATCAFQPETNIPANDSLLLTGTATGKGAPLSLNLLSPEYGLGAYIQAASVTGDTGAQFTARIQAFAGVTSVLDTTVTSDLAGDAVFLGVSGTQDAITKVIFSLTDANGNSTTGNFVLDKLYLQNSLVIAPPQQTIVITAAAPEPSVIFLFGSGLLALLFGMRKRLARA